MFDFTPAQAPMPLRFLLVGANQRWTRVVSAAAARLGASVVDTAVNSRVALSRILTATQPYSMVLLQARQTDASLDDLADLTMGDTGSRTGLLLLSDQRHPAEGLPKSANGESAKGARQPAGCIVVEQANRAAITWAMDQLGAKAGETPWDVSTAELRAALTGSRQTGSMLKLRYQPLIRLADRTPIGVEVLARLVHPRLGMLAAEQFIPQMEAAGLAPLLTERMITQAMQDTSRHGLIDLGLRIGLNVPLNVLMMPEIFGLLETQRHLCAIPSDRITLELTETQPVTDLVALGGVVRRLRDIGYQVSIDDASPAIANIEALIGLGFTTLKFDKSMVQGADDDPACREFIERIVKLAGAAGILTIAEGIENPETQELMRELGVDYAQGYLIGRPLPPAAVKLWLDAWRQ